MHGRIARACAFAQLLCMEEWRSCAQALSTPLVCVIIALWTTAFGETWKRKQAELAHKWDMEDFEVAAYAYLGACILMFMSRRSMSTELVVPNHSCEVIMHSLIIVTSRGSARRRRVCAHGHFAPRDLIETG